ncbi:MAG: sigma-70 family RNA polymerase sigma factor [Bacteroidota bacterium]
MSTQDQRITHTIQKESRRLLDFIRRRVPDEADAQDILQDVFYQLIETYRLMKPVEQLTSWLFTVARNKITDRYRKHKPESLEGMVTRNPGDEEGEMLNIADILPDATDSPEMLLLRNEIMNELALALDELPPRQREVFELHELEGRNFKEIAEITGEQVNTLLSRKRYAVLHLRRRLQTLYNELVNS